MTEPQDALFTRSLVLISLGAFAIPLACRPLRVPAAVGEIAFGILVGPHLLNLVSLGGFIPVLAELGFFLLMFLAGLELDFSELERSGRKKLVPASLAVVTMFCLAVGLTLLMGWPIFLFMVIGAMSIGVTLVLLNELGLTRSPLGQQCLLVGSLGEFGCLLIATGTNAYARSDGISVHFFLALLALVAVFGLAYLWLVVLRTLVWWRPDLFARLMETHDSSEIGVRAGLALMFIFVAVATMLRLEPILGAFLAGALFSFSFRHKGPLEVKFTSLGNGFFIPVFFITVGLRFNLPLAIEGSLLLLLELMLALFLVRLIPIALFRSPGQDWRTSLAIALNLAAPLTLLVLFANLGLSMGELDEKMHASIIMLAVVSSVLFPYLFKSWMRRSTAG
ncbi:MAG: sodium:proton antiporter [Candidatus Xenobia bacterium]